MERKQILEKAVETYVELADINKEIENMFGNGGEIWHNIEKLQDNSMDIILLALNLKEEEELLQFPNGEKIIMDDFMYAFLANVGKKRLADTLWKIFERKNQEVWHKFKG